MPHAGQKASRLVKLVGTSKPPTPLAAAAAAAALAPLEYSSAPFWGNDFAGYLAAFASINATYASLPPLKPAAAAGGSAADTPKAESEAPCLGGDKQQQTQEDENTHARLG